jgi:hypothetical protein
MVAAPAIVGFAVLQGGKGRRHEVIISTANAPTEAAQRRDGKKVMSNQKLTPKNTARATSKARESSKVAPRSGENQSDRFAQQAYPVVIAGYKAAVARPDHQNAATMDLLTGHIELVSGGGVLRMSNLGALLDRKELPPIPQTCEIYVDAKRRNKCMRRDGVAVLIADDLLSLEGPSWTLALPIEQDPSNTLKALLAFADDVTEVFVEVLGFAFGMNFQIPALLCSVAGVGSTSGEKNRLRAWGYYSGGKLMLTKELA